MIVLWLIFKSYLTTMRWGHHSLYGNLLYNYTHAPNFESCIWSPGLEAKFLKPIYSKWLGNKHTTAVITTIGGSHPPRVQVPADYWFRTLSWMVFLKLLNWYQCRCLEDLSHRPTDHSCHNAQNGGKQKKTVNYSDCFCQRTVLPPLNG